jgi:hypothetical protein
MAITIEKGIPPPSTKGKVGYTEALRGMAVGDSFLVKASKRNNVYGCARAAGIAVTIRADGDMVRVWRTA